MGKALEKGPAVWCWYERGSGEKWDIGWENGKIVNTTEGGRGLKVGIRMFAKSHKES